ncbi:hypothetical protein ACJX0J_037665, partial [Zea mays]
FSGMTTENYCQSLFSFLSEGKYTLSEGWFKCSTHVILYPLLARLRILCCHLGTFNQLTIHWFLDLAIVYHNAQPRHTIINNKNTWISCIEEQGKTIAFTKLGWQTLGSVLIFEQTDSFNIAGKSTSGEDLLLSSGKSLHAAIRGANKAMKDMHAYMYSEDFINQFDFLGKNKLALLNKIIWMFFSCYFSLKQIETPPSIQGKHIVRILSKYYKFVGQDVQKKFEN